MRKASTAAMRSAIGRDSQYAKSAAGCWLAGKTLTTRSMPRLSPNSFATRRPPLAAVPEGPARSRSRSRSAGSDICLRKASVAARRSMAEARAGVGILAARFINLEDAPWQQCG